MKKGFLLQFWNCNVPLLPRDIVKALATYLKKKDQDKMALVCKEWHEIISKENPARSNQIKLKKAEHEKEILIKTAAETISNAAAKITPFFGFASKIGAYVSLAQISPVASLVSLAMDYYSGELFKNNFFEEDLIVNKMNAVFEDYRIHEKDQAINNQQNKSITNVYSSNNFFKPTRITIQDYTYPDPYHAYAITQML